MTARRHVMLTGGWAHDFDETAPVLGARIDQLANTQTTLCRDAKEFAQAVVAEPATLVTVYACQFQMLDERYTGDQRAQWARICPPELRDALQAHVSSGGPLLAMHTAAVCFDDWAQWPELLGGAWSWESSWHPPPEAMAVVPTAGSHPLADLEAFSVVDERYTGLEVGPESTIWATSPSGEGDQAVAWSHTSAGGRVVYNSLGHSVQSLQSPGHSALLERAVDWLLGKETKP